MVQGRLPLLHAGGERVCRGQSTRRSRGGKGDARSRRIGLSYGQAVGRSAGHGLRRKVRLDLVPSSEDVATAARPPPMRSHPSLPVGYGLRAPTTGTSAFTFCRNRVRYSWGEVPTRRWKTARTDAGFPSPVSRPIRSMGSVVVSSSSRALSMRASVSHAMGEVPVPLRKWRTKVRRDMWARAARSSTVIACSARSARAPAQPPGARATPRP